MSYDIRNIQPSFEELSGGQAILIGQEQKEGYNNETKQKTGVVVGIAYTVVFPNKGYDRITIVIKNPTPAFLDEQITRKQPLLVCVNGFKTNYYISHDGKPSVSFSATEIMEVKV